MARLRWLNSLNYHSSGLSAESAKQHGKRFAGGGIRLPNIRVTYENIRLQNIPLDRIDRTG